LVLLCSPNNPTGPTITDAELEGFLAEVPDEAIVVLDEAYVDFAAEAADGLAAQRKHPNLVLARTFSKAHGLAGLRVGFGIADVEIASALRQVIAPFSVTAGPRPRPVSPCPESTRWPCGPRRSRRCGTGSPTICANSGSA